MKTAEAKTTSSPHLHQAGQPFFQKHGDNAFFSDNQTDRQTKPFFSKQEAQPFIQTKLTIGQPGDKYEQEADAMADMVVQRLSNSETIQTKPAISLANTVTPLVQPKCAACEEEEQIQKKEEDEDRLKNRIHLKPVFESDEPPPEEEIQLKCAECMSAEASAKVGETEEILQKKGNGFSAGPSLENSLSSSKGSGSPMPEETRTQMESSFGTDFGNVRIHTGSSAVQMNQKLAAQAFTYGSDIYFNSGKYNPESANGRHLLAHELTHTLQQNMVPGYSLAKKNIIQQLCDHSHCSGDPATPSCPNPAEFVTNPKLYEIRYSVFDSTKHPVVLKKGATDAAVVLIKKLLLNVHCEGYNRLAVETEPEFEFGSNTKAAVIYFQLHHKDSNGDPLLPDGIIGPATLGAMDAEMGLSVVPLPKKAEGKGRCLGVAEQGPGLTKKWDTTSPHYLKVPPFFPAVQSWEISNFDIAKFFLKTEHREFLRTVVVPEIKDVIAKSKTQLKVRIIGEASTTASNAFNLKLSFERAMCLRKTLIEFGLDAAVIESPVTFLGEELAKFMPMLRGQSLFPVDEVEDLTARRVTIVLQGPDKPDCDKTKASMVFYAYIACHTPNTYLINIMDLSDPAKPAYREFVWGHDDDLGACEFKPGFGPLSVFKIDANAPMQLAKKDPDNPLADSDFQGPTEHFYNDKGMTIQKLGVIPPYVLPVPGDWVPPHCAKQNVLMTGELNPIGPVKCGMMPVPPASDKCKEDADCTPAKKQRSAKKFVATMKWLSADVTKLLKKIPQVKKITKKIDDILDFIGIDINTSVTGAYVRIGTADDKDNPITRKFYFVGGEITGSSLPLFDADSVYAEEFTIDTPKQLETPKGDSDFANWTDLIIKGGTNHVELHISGIDKPIIFKSFFCDSGGDKKSTGYLNKGETSCSLLDTVKRDDKTCKEPEEVCPDSQKLKEDDKFIIKIGRATMADLPAAGKKLADKLGCGVTAAFINIGSMSGDEKERIYRQFIFVGKNVDCMYKVERGSEIKDFIIPRALTYPDPNDIFALSDFSGAGNLNKDGELLIISPKNIPLHIKLPGLFDGTCPVAKATGFVIPVSAVECGMVPDPMHSSTPDITDLNRCEDFKKKNIALITDALSNLKGKYSKVVSRITDPPRLIYPLYNTLFYNIGKSIPNAVFFGKAFDNQNVISIVNMQVISVFANPSDGYIFTVKILSEPCSYNEAGEPVFVLPKNCKESYITREGDYFIYPLPDIDNLTQDQQTDQNDKQDESNQHFSENNTIQKKCTACEKEDHKKLQKKSNSVSALPASTKVESNLNSSKSAGFSLPLSMRGQMENFLDADFTDVKFHTDSSAVQMNKDLNAQAFTHGSDIYFNSGKYNPESREGKYLLAHELTHVVQQGKSKNYTVQRRGPAVRVAPRAAPRAVPRPRLYQTIPGQVSEYAPSQQIPYHLRYVPPQRYDNSLHALLWRNSVRQTEEAMRFELEIPVATLERGGKPRSFIEQASPQTYSYIGETASGSFQYTPRKYHILDKIEYDISQADNSSQLMMAIALHLPGYQGLGGRLAMFGEVTYHMGLNFNVFQPRAYTFNAPLIPENLDPGGVARTSVLMAAVQTKLQEQPELREDSEVLAVISEAQDVLLVDEELSQGPCYMRPTGFHSGGNAYHNAYANHVASVLGYGVQDELEVTTPEGLGYVYDTYDPRSFSNVWEVKTRHEWTSDVGIMSAPYRPWFNERIIGMDFQRLRGLFVANRCGINFKYAFDICEIAKGMRIQWNNIPPIFYIPGPGEPYIPCDDND